MEDWKRIVVECVEMVMRDVFGLSTKDAVFYHLKVKGVGIKDAAERPDVFMEALYGIFGVGADVLEKRFAAEVGEAFGFSSPQLRLQDIVEKARNRHTSEEKGK